MEFSGILKPLTGAFVIQPYELDRNRLKSYIREYHAKKLWEFYGTNISREIFEEYLSSHYKKINLKSVRELRTFCSSNEMEKVRPVQNLELVLQKDVDENFSDEEIVKEVLRLFSALKSMNNLKLCLKQKLEPKLYEAVLEGVALKKMRRVELIIEKQPFTLALTIKTMEKLLSLPLTCLELTLRVTWDPKEQSEALSVLIKSLAGMKKLETLGLTLDDQCLNSEHMSILSKSLETMVTLKQVKLLFSKNPEIKNGLVSLTTSLTKLPQLSSLKLNIEKLRTLLYYSLGISCDVDSKGFTTTFEDLIDNCENLEEIDFVI